LLEFHELQNYLQLLDDFLVEAGYNCKDVQG